MWKRANDSYFLPDDFRVAVQPCIQALRSVTWVLKKNKAKIEAFENWYSSWEQKMKGDAVLRWLVEARNRIEKQGDLETKSKLKVTLSLSWRDGPSFESELSPMTTADEIADRMTEEVPSQLRSEEAILKIERRWVEAELPDREILEAISHSYVVLHELISEAHEHLLAPVKPSDCPSNSTEAQTILERTVSLDNPRVLWIKLRDGQQAVVAPDFQMVTRESLEEAANRYGLRQLPRHASRERNSFQDECVRWFQIAKRMLQVDKHHSPIALFQTEKTVHVVPLEMNDRAEKHIALRHLAQQAKHLNASAVFLINEAWIARAEELSDHLHAVDSPRRSEALLLHGLKSDGRFVTFMAKFSRIGGAIVFEDDPIDSNAFPNVLLPFCELWNIPKPKGRDRANLLPLLTRKIDRITFASSTAT